MTPKIITARALLLQRLQGILTSAGYLTDVGAAVLTGWPQHLLANQQASLPLLAMHPNTEAVTSSNGANMRAERTEVLEIIADQHETDADWLDRALHDIRAALRLDSRDLDGLHRMETGQAEWREADDTGALIRLTIPVTITYFDTYGDAS